MTWKKNIHHGWLCYEKEIKSDTEEGEKDKGGERSDRDSDNAETVSKSMPTSSASASVEDLGQSKS